MPENRMRDKPYGTYSVYSALRSAGVCVTCPRCGGPGTVTLERDQGRFRCTRCGRTETRERREYRWRVQNQCRQCGRYYTVSVLDQRRTYPVLRVSCPCCGTVMPGRVEKTKQLYACVSGGEVKDGRDPVFGYPLWFLTEFDGRPVWALNREHLAYLIGYLGAALREKPLGWPGGRSQADLLPAFMKTAKNRRRLVKRLEKLWNK